MLIRRTSPAGHLNRVEGDPGAARAGKCGKNGTTRWCAETTYTDWHRVERAMQAFERAEPGAARQR